MTIQESRIGFSGEFAGTTWLCNLETPDPFIGPGGLAFAVSGLAEDGSPTSSTTWTASLGPFEESLAMLPPQGYSWDFLLDEGSVKLVIEDHVPPSWDCYDRCPHGCSDVSGFATLSSLQLIVVYQTAVSNGQATWGTLKARW